MMVVKASMRKDVMRRAVGLIVCLMCVSFIMCNEARAAGTCKTVTQTQNDSIFDACKWSVEISKPRGTMWISSNSSTTSVSSKVTVDDWESGDGKVDIYLHGAIINGSGAKATYIKLVKGNSIIEGTASSYSKYSPLENVPSEMSRHGNTAPFNNNITSSVKTIKLDVNDMMKKETRDSVSGDYWIYKIPIQAFRCYAGYTPKAGEGGCYSSKSTLRVEVNIKRAITAYAVTDYRESDGAHKFLKTDGTVSGWSTSPPSDAYKESRKVDYNSSASVTMDNKKGHYEWHHWGSSCPESGRDGSKCTINPLKSNRTIYAYYELEKKNLTAYAVTDYRSSDGKHKFLKTDGSVSDWLASPPSGAYKVSKSASYGSSVDVTVANTIGRYGWDHWGSSCPESGRASGKCTISSLTSDTTVYAYYKIEFQGLSRVANALNNSSNVSTDWRQTNYTADKYVINCNDPENGCPVVIAQHLRRVVGSGTTSNGVVSVVKSHGVPDGIPCYKSNSVCEQGAADNGAPDDVDSLANGSDATVSRNMYRLKPGQMVCETFEFKPFPDGSGKASLKSCAYAVGSVNTLLGIKVKNASISKYSNYGTRDVYAKPGDKIYYQATYNPAPQYTYEIVPEKVQINSGPIYPDGSQNTTRYLGKRINSMNLDSMFKVYSSSDWGNGFSIQIDDKPVLNESYTLGDASRKTSREYNYNSLFGGKVKRSDVGKNIKGQAVTNPSGMSLSGITPKSVTFYMNSGYNVGRVNTGKVESNELFVKVPYNFTNSTEVVGLKNGNNIVYAGESVTVGYNINVGTRLNNETSGTYATIVKDAKRQLIMCEGVGCTNRASSEGIVNTTLNTGGLVDGYTNYIEDTKNVPDVVAGSWMCFKSRVYPASVLNDTTVNTEWTSVEYDWAESEEKCYQVAKKPSFQVWGGSVYSAGSITEEEVPLAKKKKLDNHSDGNYLFGSWAELSLVAGGSVKGLASGAGLGYAQIGDSSSMVSVAKRLNRNGGIESPSISDVGGGDSSGNNYYCKISTLSFVNSGCVGNGSVGNLGSSSGGGASTNKHALISDFVPNDRSRFSLDGNGFSWYELNLNDATKRLSYHVPDSEIEYYYYDSTVGGGLSVDFNSRYNPWVEKKINRGMETSAIVIDSEDDVYINSSIYYKDDGYSAIKDIPKVIIYAKENIKISCSVQRIDAVLIAEKDIDTCYDFDNINSIARSTPLTINGATISNTLNLKRTYGAATGVNSIVPAEIVNYDTSLYLWANKQADVTSSGKLTEASVRELAPRY